MSFESLDFAHRLPVYCCIFAALVIFVFLIWASAQLFVWFAKASAPDPPTRPEPVSDLWNPTLQAAAYQDRKGRRLSR